MTVSKQTLIESAEKIIENGGDCRLEGNYVKCQDCPLMNYLCRTDFCKQCCSDYHLILEYSEKWLLENKPKTITKEEETEKSNNGHTNHTRLDKILENIESLEKQKKVIEERIELSENQLQCKSGDQLLCEYLDEGVFYYTTEGCKLENTHLVRDFIDSLLKVDQI